MSAAAFSAFLFTDIEGSSLKWLNHRAAMQGALAEHDRILRAAIAAHEGEVFKTAGDAFFAAFKRPSDAANAAIAAQKALAARDFSAVDGLKARMAVHCGTAEKREGDWFGPALNRCARLLVLGHGGQILITAATAELLGSEREVKEPSRLIATNPLDDPQQPVAIHQLLVAGLPQDFPPLRAPETKPTNLPRHLTPLIGREKELLTVKDLIAANRLVTLTGPGGVGKTRLAIEAGLELLPRFANGVWLVELAPLSDAQLVVSAVGTGLRLDLSGNRPPRDILISHLEAQDLLIVLDNCEHLVDAVAELIEALLAGAPRVRIVASSQELIGLPGEQVLRVPSLALPDNAAPGAHEALKASAVQMFVERAKAADPRFLFDDKAAAVAADICKRLDGVPLALEMAAARVPALGLGAVAQGLDDRFRLLTGGKRTALPRQRTLHAALDWSHALLSGQDRTVFRRLGQFAGGFTLQAATAVVRDEALRDFEVVDGLADLVAKSLVVAHTTETGTRYRLLETTRAYALEKLAEDGEAEKVAERHAAYFGDLAERCAADFSTEPTSAWRGVYIVELENLRAALHWLFDNGGNAEAAITLAVNSNQLFDELNKFDEGQQWLERAKSCVEEETPLLVRSRLSLALGASLFHGGYAPSEEAASLLEDAAVGFRKIGNEASLGMTLRHLAFLRINQGDVERAETAVAELAPMVAHRPAPAALIWFHTLQGMVKGRLRRDFPGARSELETAIGYARSAGLLPALDFSEMVLGMYMSAAGEHEAAVIRMRALRDRISKPPFANMRRMQGTNGILALALTETGKHDEAVAAAREAFEIGRKIGTMMTNADTNVYILAAAGEFESAARLAGWADAWAANEKGVLRFGLVMRPRADAILREHLSPPGVQRLMAEGALLDAPSACALITID